MSKNTIHTFLIECQTHLHVGTGDDSYGIVDKQVQRDPITNRPVIHASSLKGAIRAFFESEVYPKDEKCKSDTKVNSIFGTEKDENEKQKQGVVRFFEAKILAYPLRDIGNGDETYHLATSKTIIEEYNDQVAALYEKDKGKQLSITPLDANFSTELDENAGNSSKVKSASVDGISQIKASSTSLKQAFEHLPIIARNHLENGQSQNLWYEEIIPRKSLFYFFVSAPESIDGVNTQTDFIEEIETANFIQIGANATIGYGNCKITKIS